jgi:hypothetical protein
MPKSDWVCSLSGSELGERNKHSITYTILTLTSSSILPQMSTGRGELGPKSQIMHTGERNM